MRHGVCDTLLTERRSLIRPWHRAFAARSVVAFTAAGGPLQPRSDRRPRLAASARCGVRLGHRRGEGVVPPRLHEDTVPKIPDVRPRVKHALPETGRIEGSDPLGLQREMVPVIPRTAARVELPLPWGRPGSAASGTSAPARSPLRSQIVLPAEGSGCGAGAPPRFLFARSC